MGRPRKNAATVPASEVNTVMNEEATTNTEKVADRVKKSVSAAKKAKSAPLTREELTQACLTPKDMIDEDGIFMGEDYSKIKKHKHSDEQIQAMKNRYTFNPVKDRMRVRIFFITQVLGMCPGDPQMFASFNAKMSMDAMTRDQEIQAIGVQAVMDKGREYFTRTSKGQLAVDTRTWFGYIGETANIIKSVSDAKSADAANIKNNIKNRISFTSATYPLIPPEGAEITFCDRPMPGDGYKRETSIKSSEALPAGTSTYFIVQIENSVVSGDEKKNGVKTKDVLGEVLDCGITHGTLGWRRTGFRGRFLWEELDENGIVIGGNTIKYLGTTSNADDFREKFYAFVEGREYEEDESMMYQGL